MSTSDGSSNIKVIARFRPLNSAELAATAGTTAASTIHNENEPFDQSAPVVFVDDATCSVKQQPFVFDRVFSTQSAQHDVFEYSLRQTVDDVMQGYNGTVLAYGQTGSGKTYTMMGPSIDDEVSRGAIPRMVEYIFEKIHHSSQDIEYTVAVSYMEIYMEKIRDLLAGNSATAQNLQIHEDKSRGIYVQGLRQEYVTSKEEVYVVMKQGSRARSVASTNMNSESSRSHAIFLVVVTQKNLSNGSQKSGQLFLVDLAGSEKVNRTGAKGQTLEEAKQINKSLSSLGNVINALTDTKAKHVPYRDSKLTRILQESLGGNSRTSLIVNCSPASINVAETLSTLRFGVRAKTIRNRAKINSEPSPMELKQLLRQSKQRIAVLEAELVSWTSGGSPLASNASTETLHEQGAIDGCDSPNKSDATTLRDASLESELENLAYKLKESDIRANTLETQIEDLTSQLEKSRQENLDLQLKLQQAHEDNEKSWNNSALERKKREKLQEILGGRRTETDYNTEASRYDTPPTEATSPAIVADLKIHVNRVKQALGETADGQVAQSLDKLLEQVHLSASGNYSPSPTYTYSSSACSSPTPSTVASPSPLATMHNGQGHGRTLSFGREEEHERLRMTLMHDLQQRCEQIVELEITLDAVRDQYNLALKNSNNKHQQQKISLLQRNLEQLTRVQRQLVEQNMKLKKEVATDEQILAARNQRIEELEDHLREAQLVIVRERDIFAQNLTALGDHLAPIPAAGYNRHQGTIVRPLRGGGS